MNKFRLVNAALFVVIAVMAVLACMSHVNSKNTQGLHASLSEIGHHLIEARDRVVNRYSMEERKTYEITESLVELELAAENLCTVFKQSIWFEFTPTKNRVKNIVAQFDGKVRDATQTLDMLIGVQVANQYESLTLHNIYQRQFAAQNDDSWLEKHYFNFLTNAALQGDNPQSQNISLFLNRLRQSERKIELLTNKILESHYFEFVEYSEHQLLEIAQREARLTWVFVLLSIILLVTVFVLQTQHRVNKLKHLNDELTEATEKAERAAKAKSQFLATMSHELRTPMNGVLGISQIIASETQEKTTKEHVKVILDSGQHLMTILNDILDFSKVEENKLELEAAPFNLPQVLTPVCSAIQPLIEEKNIQLYVENEVPENIEFNGDCARIRQILFNLAGNAVKFTGDGHVLIRAELDEQRKRLLLSVNDTGIGIPEDKQGRIFNSFEQADTSTTRKFGGTGLGLAIVKKLTELMSGEIKLKSVESIGTQFLVDLPIPWVEKEQPAMPNTKAEQQQENKRNLHILLAEDNRVNAIVAKGFCEKLGHTVEIAENGLIATKKAQENQYDLILMDNHMPEMNGVEATRFIREKLGVKTLLFAYTADVFREAHDNFIDAGADHVLTKPLQRESFADALKQFASRLPVQNDVSDQAENVVELHREPIERLRLTEEELTHSETVEMLKEEPDALLDLLESIVNDFEKSVDELIEYFMAENLSSLYSTLHTTKGMALNLGLDTLANQALEIETQVKNKQIPDIEQLQKLINRLQVNIHQGQRLIDRCRKQQTDSNQVI
ncbi:ATP-binding protein [Vibrio harveyi]|jgi:signal transduction histidine kinase/DNA-binding response OmpR family regulator|uniref:ATP-binding protein n=1 Tax=Vibrio harveyi TaxID=669 RepID=UPI0023808C2A|nr:ATP-binding protein [Vibrio harveyi]EMD1174671.1 response regulator [Vibrio harveyi]MDF6015905.1 response regulator [Vibrio harveyi]HDM8160556.1 response regulator [Vibrio harveyi]HDM8167269.1 response regulator [Vibrio harveyi]HDM8188050.1 response regulator [Vibrio harveyi]